MYICKSCEECFEEPQKHIETHGFDNPPYEEFNICPHCNSDDIIEAQQCEGGCAEWFDPEDLEDTTEMINGGCGYCCPGCIENGDMKGNSRLKIVNNYDRYA